MCASCDEALESAIEQVTEEHCDSAPDRVDALRRMRARLQEEINDVLGQTGRGEDDDEDESEGEEDADGD